MTIHTPPPTISKGVRRLRIGLVVLVVILVLGQVVKFLTYYPHYDSLSEYWKTHGYFYRRAERQVVQLLLLLAITYTTKRHLWGVGLLVLLYKLVSLVNYYIVADYQILSSNYYDEYFGACVPLGLYWPGIVIFGDGPISLVALIMVYIASIWVCWTQIRRPQAVELAV